MLVDSSIDCSVEMRMDSCVELRFMAGKGPHLSSYVVNLLTRCELMFSCKCEWTMQEAWVVLQSTVSDKLKSSRLRRRFQASKGSYTKSAKAAAHFGQW